MLICQCWVAFNLHFDFFSQTTTPVCKSSRRQLNSFVPKIHENMNFLFTFLIHRKSRKGMMLLVHNQMMSWGLSGLSLNGTSHLKSEVKILQKVKSGHCFDEAFNENQKGDVQEVMVWTKVTKEFMEEEKKCKGKQGIQQARKYSA